MHHPHKKAISDMDASSLIGIIEESKMTYVRENLSIFLHESQIKLLKRVKKHEKPHHKKLESENMKRLKRMICLTCIWDYISINIRNLKRTV